MGHLKVIITTIFLVFFAAPTGDCQDRERLLDENSLTYIGAFRLTKERVGCDAWDDCVFAYGGSPIAFDPSGNNGKGSLFIGSHVYSQKVAEVTIPDLVVSDNLNDLNTASILQGFNDITEGNRKNILGNGAPYAHTVNHGGLMVYGDRLIGSVYTYYPSATQVLSHYVSSKNLSEVRDFSGMYKISTAVDARFLAGYMDTIPPEWQERLGGRAITGIGGLSIISTTSVGPSAFAFDPSDLGVKIPAPTTTLMYYPLSHPLGAPDSSNSLFNYNATVRGVVFPEGYDSVLFFGAMGVGDFCYGIGTSDRSLVGQFLPGSTTDKYDCYDPADTGKGSHAYPYMYRVWFYDANDFVRVRNEGLAPWEIRPYRVWNFEMPFNPRNAVLLGTAYDKANRKLYISQDHGDDSNPLIHVYQFPDPAGPRPQVLHPIK